MSAKKLPFLIAPKKVDRVQVGNENIGILEIPRYYDLTPSERIFIEKNLKDVPDVQSEVVKIAVEIAEKSGEGLVQTYSKLSTGDLTLLEKHLPEFLKVQKLQRDAVQVERNVYATAILSSRVDAEWTLDDTGDPELILPRLVEEIYTFSKKELNGWSDPEPPTEEDLKKSTEAKGEIAPTGEQSSGESENSGLTMSDSTNTTLEAVPVM